MDDSHVHHHGMKSGRKNKKTPINSFLWHKSIPFIASFVVWSALKGKLPTNENLINFGKKLSNCFCCSNRKDSDTIENIFNRGHFAAYFCKNMAAIVRITPNQSSLQYLHIQWWNTKNKNGAHKLLLQDTPIIVSWNLWKSICAGRYGKELLT